MRLARYLSTKPETQAEFGARVGLSQPAINRYLANERFPSTTSIGRISEATAHRVTVTDWYEQAAETRAAKAAEQPTPKIPVQA